MANTSFNVAVSTPLTVATMGRFIRNTTDPRQQASLLSQMFSRIAAGLLPCNIDVQTSGSPPVRATNTLTLTYASIANNDTCVVAGVTLTCVTGTPTSVQFKKQTDATVTAANLAALINTLSTVSRYCSATSAAGVVTITVNTPGLVGNFVPLVGSTGIVAGAATFAGGTGGLETAAVNYALGG